MRRAQNAITGRQRIPKTRLRIPRMTGNSSLIQSRYVAATLTVADTATQSNSNVLVSPAVYSGVPGDAGGNVLLNYQEYKMVSGRCDYTPVVGSTTAGVVYLAYFDNSEIIQKVNTGGYTLPTILSLVKNAPTVTSGPVWMEQSIQMGQRTRRPKYGVDTAGTSSIETADRCVHGIFVAVVDGVTQASTTDYGVLTISYSVEGYGLQNANLSAL